ncbi:Procardosin-A [Platanthera zijinensis]|uniref:Procardosin-A n=1 Tax=Platanthera zijinensis TaxID=2320716 RepID=A0AAP0AS68_9ASPA
MEKIGIASASTPSQDIHFDAYNIDEGCDDKIDDVDIESVVKAIEDKSAHSSNDVMCSACKMAIVWMQNRLKQNQTQEKVLNQINQAIIFSECMQLCVGDCRVLWETPLSTVVPYLPCLLFLLTLEARHLTHS